MLNELLRRWPAASIVALLMLTNTSAVWAKGKTLVSFCAMGDTPYTPIEFLSLPKQIAELPKEAEFAVHLGDIKAGAVPCVEPLYERVAKILGRSKPPMFIVPGDNEWNDCGNPDRGWKLWTKYFMRFDERWKHDFAPTRQRERQENFAFARNGVLFVGLNLVGGKVHDAREWKLRHQVNLRWLEQNLAMRKGTVTRLVVLAHATPQAVHNDFFDGLVKQAKRFDRPVLYLHGDGHVWKRDRPWKKTKILRVQVDQGLEAPPVLVSVTDDKKKPFVFDRRKPKKKDDKKKKKGK